MKFHTIWGYDKYDDDWAMIDAWSENNVGENYEGWKEAVDKAKADEMNSDVRVVDITVPMADLRKALDIPVVKASKVEAGGS